MGAWPWPGGSLRDSALVMAVGPDHAQPLWTLRPCPSLTAAGTPQPYSTAGTQVQESKQPLDSVKWFLL